MPNSDSGRNVVTLPFPWPSRPVNHPAKGRLRLSKVKLRAFLLSTSLVVSSFSAVFSLFGGYPIPEMIALFFLYCAMWRITGVTILTAMVLIATFIFGDHYYIWSTLIFFGTALIFFGLGDLRKLCSTPTFIRCMTWCFYVNMMLILLQTIPAVKSLTESVFEGYVTFGTGSRVAGFKQEPSHLVVFVGVAFLLMHYESKLIVKAVLGACLALMIYLSNSALLLLGSICMCLFVFFRNWLWYLAILVLPLAFYALTFSATIVLFMQDTQQSWRSVPDIALTTSKHFFWPDFSRDKELINIAVNDFLGSPSYITWTYSAFANGIFSLGILGVVTASLMWMHRVISRNGVSKIFEFFGQAWPVFAVILFVVPKYEVLAMVLFIAVVYETLDAR